MEPLEEAEFALHRVLTHVLLGADLVFASRLYRVIGVASLQSMLLGACAATIVFYCLYITARGRIILPLLAAAYVALVMNQLTVFAEKLWLPVNPNTFFQFIWILCFVPFAGICLAGGRSYLLKCLVGYGTFYCAFFAAASVLQMAGALPGQVLAAIVSSDVERGARIFLYTGLACFTYFYWLVRICKTMNYRNLLFFGVAASASVLSLSRVYLLSIFCLTLAFLLKPKPSTISVISRSILLLGTLFVMSGMIVPTFNPYELFSGDTSGAYRAMEYGIVRERIMDDLLWGFGISPDIDLTKPFLGKFQIFAGDLGPLGVWFDFGLTGFCLFFVILWWCSKPQRSLSPGFGWPLFLTGCMMTVNGWLSPLAISPGGATMTALILAIGLTATKGLPDTGGARRLWSKTGGARTPA
jgi:hypothetical protein